MWSAVEASNFRDPHFPVLGFPLAKGYYEDRDNLLRIRHDALLDLIRAAPFEIVRIWEKAARWYALDSDYQVRLWGLQFLQVCAMCVHFLGVRHFD